MKKIIKISRGKIWIGPMLLLRSVIGWEFQIGRLYGGVRYPSFWRRCGVFMPLGWDRSDR